MIVLTYHSHHVVGDDYARNDHIALPIDLRVITDLGFEIVSLEALRRRLGACGGGRADGAARK